MQGDTSVSESLALEHLQIMTGPLGLYQHATKRVPLLREGYCTDDNARAVQFLVELGARMAPSNRGVVDSLLDLYWRFVWDAQEKPGSLFNFRTAKGEWLPHGRSEDMYARVMRMCSTMLLHDWDVSRQQRAGELLKHVSVSLHDFSSIRAWAEALIALSNVSTMHHAETTHARQLISEGVAYLIRMWQQSVSEDWQWFESTMTYSNALLPHGLLRSFLVRGDKNLLNTIHSSAHFLISITVKDDIFVPIGSRGWYPRGGRPSRDNQQPIEAGTMLDFLLEYYTAFPDKVSLDLVLAPYLWFFGKNTNRVIMADMAAGASLDGLFVDGPNPNYGAESMLAYLSSELRIAAASKTIRDAAWRQRERLLALLQ